MRRILMLSVFLIAMLVLIGCDKTPVEPKQWDDLLVLITPVEIDLGFVEEEIVPAGSLE